MDGKELLKLQDLGRKFLDKKEECEKTLKESATEPKEVGKFKGMADAFRDAGDLLTKLLREMNS